MTVGKLRDNSGNHSTKPWQIVQLPIVLGPRNRVNRVVSSLADVMLARAIAFRSLTQHLLSTWRIAALYAFLAM